MLSYLLLSRRDFAWSLISMHANLGVPFKHLPSRETPNSNHRDHNIHTMSILHSENSLTVPTGRAEPELASKVLGSEVLKEPTHCLCGGEGSVAGFGNSL